MKPMLCDINQTTQPIRPHKMFNNWDMVAKGWYVVGKSSELKKNKTLTKTIFGHQLVIFRTASGKACALDAFCPHMGMNLVKGKVVGETIKCLFHEWKFNAKGDCVDIPCPKEKVTKGKSAKFTTELIFNNSSGIQSKSHMGTESIQTVDLSSLSPKNN